MSAPDDEAVWFVQRRWGSKGWARVSGHVRDGRVLYLGVALLTTTEGAGAREVCATPGEYGTSAEAWQSLLDELRALPPMEPTEERPRRGARP